MDPAPPAAPTGLQHAYVLDGNGAASRLDWDGVRAWTASDGVLWLNLDYSVADASSWLARESGLDDIALDALRDVDPRPRATPRADALLIILRGINLNTGAAPEDMISVRIHADAHRVITLHHRASRSLKSLAADFERGHGPRDVGDFIAQLAERICEHVVTGVDVLGDEVAASEELVVTGARGDLRTSLAQLRRRAIALRRFLAPEREALAKLAQTRLTWWDERCAMRAAETLDRMTRTIEELDAARERAAVTQEELASRIAEVTNQRLYILSLITAVFLPLGFVCALLGVNVGGVPLQGESWAFWALLGAFAVGVGCQLWLFKRRGWL